MLKKLFTLIFAFFFSACGTQKTVITVLDIEEKSISGAEVSYENNGKTITQKTNAKGEVKLNLTKDSPVTLTILKKGYMDTELNYPAEGTTAYLIPSNKGAKSLIMFIATAAALNWLMNKIE